MAFSTDLSNSGDAVMEPSLSTTRPETKGTRRRLKFGVAKELLDDPKELLPELSPAFTGLAIWARTLGRRQKPPRDSARTEAPKTRITTDRY
jgi:hypothetical protein